MHPYHHALSSAKKFGGRWCDYLDIHSWFDETKSLMGDARHRALRHHAAGIFWCEQQFGRIIHVGEDGKTKAVPTRLVAEQHVTEDMGFIPTVEWWLSKMPLTYDMNHVPTKSRSLDLPSDTEVVRQLIARKLYEGEG